MSVRYEGLTELIVMDLSPDARTIAAMGTREQLADEASLRHILAPASIAVIGAGARPDSVGHQVLQNILAGGFTGTVYAVNPHHDTVLAVPCVPGARQLPVAVDLAVISVPAVRCRRWCATAASAASGACCCSPPDSVRSGTIGQDRQRQVVAIARRYGMRLVGPNCLGVCNTDPAVRLNATFAALPTAARRARPGVPVRGRGYRGDRRRRALRTGFSQFVSVGNKADVSGNDLLLAWEDDDRDPSDRAVSGVLRQPAEVRPDRPPGGRQQADHRHQGRPVRRRPTRRSVAHRGRGVLGRRRRRALHPGRGAPGGHHGTDAGRSPSAVRPTAAAGPRVAVVGNSGGPGILAADAAESAGLRVVSLSGRHRTATADRRFRPRRPAATRSISGRAVRPVELAAALQVLLRSDEVDAMLAIFTDVAVSDPEQADGQHRGEQRPAAASR